MEAEKKLRVLWYNIYEAKTDTHTEIVYVGWAGTVRRVLVEPKILFVFIVENYMFYVRKCKFCLLLRNI